MDDTKALVARLRAPEHSEETMLWWDKLRARIKKDNGSGPRDAFENFLDTLDEERNEAADALEAALAEIKRLRKALMELEPMLERLHDNNKIISDTARALLGDDNG